MANNEQSPRPTSAVANSTDEHNELGLHTHGACQACLAETTEVTRKFATAAKEKINTTVLVAVKNRVLLYVGATLIGLNIFLYPMLASKPKPIRLDIITAIARSDIDLTKPTEAARQQLLGIISEYIQTIQNNQALITKFEQEDTLNPLHHARLVMGLFGFDMLIMFLTNLWSLAFKIKDSRLFNIN